MTITEKCFKDHRIKVKVEMLEQGSVTRGAKYKITFKRFFRSMSFEFYDSVYNYKMGFFPEVDNMVSALPLFSVGTMKDFYNEYWSDITSGKELEEFYNCYKATCDLYKKVRKFFTKREIKELRNLTFWN